MVWPIDLNSLGSSAVVMRAPWVIVLMIGIASLSWSGYQDFLIAPPDKAITSQSAPVNVRASQVSISALVDAHLFGQPQQTAAEEPAEAITAPETRLRVQLRGVFSHSDPTRSRALIAEQGKSAKYYRLGDSLSGSSTLHVIATEHVVLDRNGQLETLSFEANTSASQNRQVATINSPNDRKSTFTAAPTVDPAKKLVSTPQRTESIKDRLMRLRESRDL